MLRTSNSIVTAALAAAMWLGLTSMPSVAGESEELFFAYACGRTLCSKSVETVPDSGFTRRRFVKTDRYVSDASITFTVVDGKRVLVADSLMILIPGNYLKRHYMFDLSDPGPTTTWVPTNTDGEFDFFVIKGREALAYTPYPLRAVEHPVSTIISTGN